MKLHNKLLLAMALVSSLASVNAMAATQTWNLARDMYLMDNGIPAGSPWSFMRNTTATSVSANYTAFPLFYAQCPGGPSLCWRAAATGAGSIAIPKQTFTGGGGGYSLKQGDVYAHPGPAFQTIFRWASPVEGGVNVLGRVNDLDRSCGDGIRWSLNLGDTVIKSGNLANGGSAQIKADDVAVTKESSLYLVIDKKGNYSCDSTSVDLLIAN
ncbi:hypothetical protein NJC40_20495 [Pseudomonas sp. 21LCFQ02]|uniref:hypothetical protein n=1 Tax=Pseudomonas sp. 21LCFQ02 TaxID=2957505 RepID=UPI00209BAC46|nr:hypothetical protein [Pseudomonas sp. 21LCFQ02]MCO8170146.1 hypothetical protein [Pseudomonas sp. 21LCFQ02]